MRQGKLIVLAYSGGLDTSIIIPWLHENSLLRNGIATLEGLHYRILTINELLVPVDFAIFILCEIRIQLGNGTAVFGRNLVFLIAQGFTQLFEESRSINQLNFALAFRTLILGENPNVCSDAGVVKEVCGQRNDGFDQLKDI